MPQKWLVCILKEEKHGAFVSIQPWLILIKGIKQLFFKQLYLCGWAGSYENGGKFIADHFVSNLSGKCDITKHMLKNKHLREILSGIDQAQDQETMLKNAMNEPIFTEFVDHCLNVVKPAQTEKNEEW